MKPKWKINNSDSKNNIEERNGVKPDTDNGIGNNVNKEKNSQENNASESKEKYHPSNEAEHNLDNNNNREKELNEEETEDKQDKNNKNDNRDEIQQNEEIDEEDDKDKIQALNNNSQDKMSSDSDNPNNTQVRLKGLAKYKGINLNELPEDIRLMLMELMKREINKKK